MCGIVTSLNFLENSVIEVDETTKVKINKLLTTELLLLTESRGKDATGACVLFEDGYYTGLKHGEKAVKLVGAFDDADKEGSYPKFLDDWEKYQEPTKVYMGHCRSGTVGSRFDNDNNHPIKIGDLIGIHNGTIKNHDIIFKKLGCKRTGKVDSECIFRLLQYLTKDGAYLFTLDMMQEVVYRLSGTFAVVTLNVNNPNQVPVFRDSRPIEMAFIKELGLLFLFSERTFWDLTLFRYERFINLYKLDLPSLQNMTIEHLTFQDDSCRIFDLNTKIDNKTKIDDLGAYRKLIRTNKIWESLYTKANDKDTTIKDNGEKDNSDTSVKVFNNILRIYEVKHKYNNTSEKTLPNNESIILTFPEKDAVASKGIKVGIDDYTRYEIPINEEKKLENTPVVVLTDALPPDVIKLVEDAYKKVPYKDKGYNNIEDMLDDADIDTTDKANEYGILCVVNRLFKKVWKKGFVRSYYTDHNNNEIHRTVAALKMLNDILIKFHSKIGSQKDSMTNSELKNKLSSYCVSVVFESKTIDETDKETMMQLLKDTKTEESEVLYDIIEEELNK